MASDSVSATVEKLIAALEGSGLQYAFGGAIALAAWSEPRATADVDVVVWIDADKLEPLLDVLARSGVTLDTSTARADAHARGMFVGRMGTVRVDVFVPSIPFYEEAERRRVRTSMAGRETWIHSAETLAVFKLLFFRPKDVLDVRRMLEVQGSTFDRDFVRGALVLMLGEDERIDKWDELCRDTRVSSP